MKNNKKNKTINLEFLGYLIEIDAYDYDFFLFLHKTEKEKEYYIKKIMEKAQKYDTEISYSLYELYKSNDLKDFHCNNFFDILPYEDPNKLIVENELNIEINENNKNTFLTKLVKQDKLKMPITEKNKKDFFDDKIHKLINSLQNIYHYNGADLVFDQESLNEVKNLIKDIEDFQQNELLK